MVSVFCVERFSRGLEGCVRWRDRWEIVWRPSWYETGEVEGGFGSSGDGGFGREKG